MRFASAAALAALVAFSTTAKAATYTLVAPGGGINELTILVLGVIPLETSLSGTINTHQNGNTFTGVTDFEIASADIDGTGFNYSNPYLGTITSGPVHASGSSGSIPVTDPPGAGTFDAAGITISLDSGIIAVNVPLIDANTINLDLSDPPIDFNAGGGGAALGTITSTGPLEYTITIPINFATVLDPQGLAVAIGVQGTIVAVAVVPEPASGLFLATFAAGAGAVVRRRRR